MEAIKKVLTSIFICLMTVFLMSHNTFALSTGSFKLDTAIGEFKTALDDNFDGAHACNENVSSGSPTYQKIIFTNWNFSNVTPGNNYLVAFTFFNSANNNSFDGHIPVEIKPYYDDLLWVKQVEIEQVSDSQFVVYMIVEIRYAMNVNMKFKSDDWFMLYPNECIGNYGWYTRIQWTGDPDYRTQLQTIINYLSGLNGSMPSPQTIEDINNNIENLNDSVDDLNDTVKDHYDKEDEANDNISNQDPDDLKGDTDNQASTNLVGLFQSFITALSNITQANNCNLSLAFPSYAGGTINVNVCQYKDKGGNIVAIFSSLTMVIFYIPLALKLLSIIYNEIRSFTNG